MSRHRVMVVGLVGALVASVLGPLRVAPAAATTLPTGFQEQIVFTGLTQPVNIEFAGDGRVFVAEKGGVIKVFDDLADTTPTVFADLSTNVHNQWDRGLLGMALAPNFPTNPWVYVLYTYDAPPGQTAPVWNDVCADANNGTCVVTGRLSKLQAAGNVMTGTEQVLVHDWCQQYPSHSIGDLHFGADGMLYASGGDGASFSNVDYGQLAGASNPCGDPPGGSMDPPSAEGGALRSQDIRTTGDPTSLDGTILRLDPVTGAAAAGNPMIGSADLNARRIVAHGVRNPFRFAIRPGTNEVWIDDTGWNTWEEIDRLVNPTASTLTNFGWPCYEGTPKMGTYDAENLTLCESLYTAGTATAPYYSYNHGSKVVSGEACPSGNASRTGVAFYPTSGPYPAQYQGALFFADYSRDCIWAMRPATAGGLPSTGNIQTFGAGAANPVDLAIGPGNELYYVDIGGTVRRFRYFPGNQPPTAAIAATPTGGPAPLTVNFSATGSTDPDPADEGRLTYAWDFTNDGTTDSTAATTSFTYTSAGTFTAKLTVTDTLGATDTETVNITPGNNAPTAVMDTPTNGTTWRVGNTINFTGHATDPQQGNLPASALEWHLRIQHCSTPENCHTHFLQDWTGVASGSFNAPDHEYPSYLELELKATDSDGLSHSVVRRLDPLTVDLTFASTPSGLQLTAGAATGTTPFTRTVIQGSSNALSAPSPQTLGATTYTFGGWSDGGAQSHVITAPNAAATYTATYTGGQAAANLALNKPATADSQCAPSEGPAKAVNGTVNGGWSDKWCSLGTNKWLRVDLGSNVTIGRFVVRHAGAGGEDTVVNTRDFTISVSNDGTNFSTAVTVTGNTANVTTHDIATSGRYVRLDIQRPASDGDPAARIYEFEVYGETGPPPQPAVVQGTVTAASGGAPIAGATVTVSGTSLSATTAANGTYSFPDVPTGSRTITAQKAGFLPGSVTVTATSGATATGNIALTAAPACADSFGYVCTSGPRTFVPADQTVLTVKGDDEVQQITLPFPVKFYGQTYTTAWVDTNGLISFAQLNSSAWNHSSIPSAAASNKANLAAYPFWDDLDVDASASIRTAVTGTAPNRQFIVEWRNVRFFANNAARVSFEVVFDESGTVTFAYSGIDALALEQGGDATVGIENATGTVALQYSLNQPVLRTGNGVTFTPPA